jgi:predicted phosphohydrolase
MHEKACDPKGRRVLLYIRAQTCYNLPVMKVYAISDLHLSGTSDKPMDVFGAEWEGHFSKIKADWEKKVTDDDVVLIGGDTSWGMKTEEGMYDVASLAPLKGRKVFIRGNHDFWWSGITKIRSLAPDPTFTFLQNDCVRIENVVIAGSRGWTCPGSADFQEHDMTLYLREAERFRLAFAEVKKVRREGDLLIALIHYPPFSVRREDTLFTQLFEENNVDKVVFGHLHGGGYFPLRSEKGGAEYYLTSCDKTKFTLTEIYDSDGAREKI